ncbi:MAG: M9 family metallopeptidase N-terminal domain-containing protein, partial [Erysipelotrichales bacterium]
MKNGKSIADKSLRKTPFSKKVLCSMCTLMLASTCANSLTLASTIKLQNQEVVMQEPQGALEEKITKSEKFEHIGDADSKGNTLSMQQPPQLESTVQHNSMAPYISRGSVTTKYTMDQLANMSYSDMIETVCNMSEWNNATDLFKYNSGNQKFYEDKSRVQAIVDAIGERGKTFTSSDDKGI